MFSKQLLHWHRHHNHRVMPWKGERDPYRIWISEIILQQTRVEQGIKYYENLITKYPQIEDLARATDTDVYKLWQGLGYYNRCRNMLFTAREIATRPGGKFPDTYEEIIKLKGIGAYTAAAIASFAFHLPYAVVDGNVVRILSRVFGMHTDFNSPEGKKIFQALAGKLLSKKNNAEYNQAIMDLGATVCKPRNPVCAECPFEKKCLARQSDSIALFPVKKIKAALKNRYFHFFIFEQHDSLFISKRNEKDIWQNLHVFHLMETTNAGPINPWLPRNALLQSVSPLYTQILTHQKIHGWFYRISISKAADIASLGLTRVKKSDLNKFAFPRMIISFFEKNNYL